MNVDNVRLWVEDLERNQHPQARGVLCKTDEAGRLGGYCCLGRGCEVAIAHGLELEVMNYGFAVRYDGAETTLPRSVQAWLGIQDDDLIGKSVTCFYSELASRNDKGSTFPEIARYIRKHVAGL